MIWNRMGCGLLLLPALVFATRVCADQPAIDFRYAPPNWQTAICLPDDPLKSLVDKSGALLCDCPRGARQRKISVAVEVIDGARWVKQELESPRVPIVRTQWAAGGVQIVAEAFATTAAPRADVVIVRVANSGPQGQTLRPRLRIHSPLPVAADVGKQRVLLGNELPLVCSLRMENVSEPQKDERLVQLAPLAIEPGKSAEFCVVCGSDGPALSLEQAQACRAAAVEFWRRADLPYGKIQVPDPAGQALLDSCIRNIWQAREIKNGLPAFQVGPTCYRGLWVVDGSFILETAALLGRVEEARRGIDYLLSFQRPDGGFMLINQHWKETGIVLWAVTRHARLTGDKAWLEAMWPKLQRGLEFIRQMRREASADPHAPSAGLIPLGFSDGGLGGPAHEYTNVYWTLAGLHAAAEAADWLGQPDRAAPWHQEYDDFLAAFGRAAARDLRDDGHGNRCLPIVMQAKPDLLPQKAQWAFLHAVYPGCVFDRDDPLVRGNMAMLRSNECEGLVLNTGWLKDGLWNYFGSFYGHAWLWLGDGPKAAQTLCAMANHASPLLCWREEHMPQGQGDAIVGDMPHNWASAEFIRLTVHLVALDRGDELHLLEGLPGAWLRPGAVTRLEGVVTPFGPLTLELQVPAAGGPARLAVAPLPAGRGCKRVVVHLPEGGTRELDPAGRHEIEWPIPRK